MSWITVTWSMAAGMSLTLAAVHLLVWLRDREAVANLLFSVSAVAAAVIAIQERCHKAYLGRHSSDFISL